MYLVFTSQNKNIEKVIENTDYYIDKIENNSYYFEENNNIDELEKELNTIFNNNNIYGYFEVED
jgi:hypothetical protein